MHGYIHRLIEEKCHRALGRSPAVAILGPRQCGKSTTAKILLENIPSVYFDLQDRVDRSKLAEPELFFDRHRDKLICLDEIQRCRIGSYAGVCFWKISIWRHK
jgi:predicted AAA+ superfamily ATPase